MPSFTPIPIRLERSWFACACWTAVCWRSQYTTGDAALRTWRKHAEPLFTTGGEERSGMGFTIMESFMDTLKVRSRPGKGTVVTMRKRIAQRAGRA